MLKVLTKALMIRMSAGMYGSFEKLAKIHKVPVTRIIRAGLWLFLREAGKHREDGFHDDELAVALANLDFNDVGQKGYDFTPEGRAQEEADYKAGLEDDGKPEE